MAFNVGISSKDAFKELKKLTPPKRIDYVNSIGSGAASFLTSLTPAEFAELFPKYYQRGLPDVSGFREAISRRSRQKQDDINFGLSQGAKSFEEAERMGSWRRRGGDQSEDSVSASGRLAGKFTAANYVAILKQAGFSDKDAKLMAAVGMQESNGRIDAHNDANPARERSYGLFQININAHDFNSPEMRYAGVKSIQDLYDPLKNAKVAYYLYHNTPSGIKHWGGYTDGGYKKYLAAAEAVSGTPAGIPSATGSQNFDNISTTSSKIGGFFGNDQQCVSLSKHFSGLGSASGWRVKSGNIAPGTVIATMRYNDGSGGKMAKDMPDGRSHYHTGIALTSPNAKGEVLILEQFAGQPARVRSININNYNGEQWGVVEGGEPSAGTMKAVEIGKGLANQDQLAWIDASAGQATPTEQNPTVEVKPTQQAGVATPTLTTNETQPQYPEQQQHSTTETARVEKPDKSKKTFQTYKFDADKYYDEVNTKHPEAKFFGYDKERIMKETYQGFEEAQAAGAIKWNKKTHEIQVLEPNHEALQKIYKDMQEQNIDRNQFLTQTEAGGSGTAKVSKVKRAKLAGNKPAVESADQPAEVGRYEQTEQMDIDKLMALIRRQESGSFEGNYSADLAAKKTKKGQRHDTASGAYQYNDRTWRGVLNDELGMGDVFRKYPRAVLAPKEIQDSVTRARIEKWRESGHSDREIFLHHFTGNRYGKLDPRAQKGNPTPGEYAAQMAKHVEEYDRTVKPTLVAQQQQRPVEVDKSEERLPPMETKPVAKESTTTAEQPTATVTQQVAQPVEKSNVDRAKELLGIPTSLAEEQREPTKAVFERMRQIRPPVAEPVQHQMPEHIRTNVTPTTEKDVEDFLLKHPLQQPLQPEHHSMNVSQEKLQAPVVVDSFLKQSTTGFPSPSLERAMNNTRGFSEVNPNRINMGTSIA